MRYIGFALLAGTLLSAQAQDIYQMERFSHADLNGTARYVGMGGALGALGADISAMSTNPASIGMYRRSDVALSASLVSQAKGDKFDGKSLNHISFDQIGFVYSAPMSSSTMRYFNFGFNYNKRYNNNMVIGAAGGLNGISQTWQMVDLASYWWNPNAQEAPDALWTPLTQMGYETYLFNETGEFNEAGYPGYSVFNGMGHEYHRAQKGGVQQYDFNFSCNLNDRFYLGLTVSAYNVDMSSYSEYSETLDAGHYVLTNERDLSGNGFDVKLGTIIRPIEESPFRIGFSFATPIYYSLTANTASAIYSTMQGKQWDYGTAVDNVEYNIRTPWRFNLSLGHTIGKNVALGAEYEYADYSSAKVTYDDYDWDGWGSQTKDRELNRQAEKFLKGVSTLKLGAEVKLMDNVSFRAGYNYVSSPFKKEAYLNQFINSASLDWSTSTDYMNLSEINRYTCGFGFRDKHFYADVAYQYQQQDGEFYAFNTQQGMDHVRNELRPTTINLDKHQLLITLGYKF